MTDLFWPGDFRACEIFSDSAFLAAMAAVENAWLTLLVAQGVAPATAQTDLTAVVSKDDVAELADAAEQDGNPVPGLARLLRARVAAEPARWLHRGLTSQDVVDTALMLCGRQALERIGAEIATQIEILIELAERHDGTPMLARTLTQPALPSTLGVKVAHWLSGVLDAVDTLNVLPSLPVQAGGAAGTLAAATELAGTPEAAIALCDALADALGLAPSAPWHTARSVLTRIGDVCVTCTDAWGHIANDVAMSSRSEIGEMGEGRPGGSSSMPHKRNPVLSILIRRAALTAPALGAVLHQASSASVDERADGGWHAEWATLRTLARHTVSCAAQTTELLQTVAVNSQQLAENLQVAHGLFSEQHSMAELTGRAARSDYTGAAAQLVESTLQRARQHQKERS